MEGREKNAETQAGCHRHVLHRILAAASPKRKCDRLFKVTSPAAHTHLTRARGHGLSAEQSLCSKSILVGQRLYLRGYCRSDALEKRTIIATRSRCCGRTVSPPF